MKNAQNITIVLLLVTASALTALLLASYLYPEPAYGYSGMIGGDYVIAAGAYNAETDFIYVLDIASSKLNVYFANINTNALVLGDTVDLAKFFGTAGGARR